MFENLPETFPKENKRNKPALFGSAALHIVVIGLLLIVPLWTAQYVEIRSQLITRLYLPVPPPAALGAPSVAKARPQSSSALERLAPDTHQRVKSQPVTDKPLIAPTVIPSDIRTLADLESPSQGVIEGVSGGVGGIIAGIPRLPETAHQVAVPPPPLPPSPRLALDEPVHVGGSVKEPLLLKYVAPEYPLLARKASIQGTVVLQATISKSGAVSNVQLVSGSPALADAAIAAVRQWRYEPTRLNGIPVAVILSADVIFSLGSGS